MSNPHLRAWRRMRRHRRREEGAWRGLAAWLPVLAVGGCSFLVQRVFYAWLPNPDLLAMGVEGLSFRLGLLGCGAMSLHTYTALVRGPDRDILDPHPVDPAKLLPYLLARTAWERLPLAAALVAALAPVAAAGHPLAFALGGLVAVGGWLVGLLVGFPIHLGSVWAAESPALAGLLEALRGDNPRLQAALIYAPGVVLGVGGIAVALAADGAESVLNGHLGSSAWLLAPAVLGGLAWAPAAGLARAYHHRTTTLLAEIDARYASVQAEDDDHAVYLEWTVRFVPAGLRRELLKELRHGWRGLRSWVTGAWGAGVATALVGWSGDADAPAQATAVGGAALLLIGGVALRLASRDPDWLDRALPVEPARRGTARAIAVFGWMQGVVIPTAAAVAVRHGSAAAAGVTFSLEAVALALVVLGATCSRLRARGWAPYLVGGLLGWASIVGGVA